MTQPTRQTLHISPFIVKESSLINYSFAAILSIIAIIGFIAMSSAKYQSLEAYRFIILIALVPALLFWKRGASTSNIFEINTTGIYYREKLITTWANFVNAYLLSEEVPGSLSEHFLLIVDYFDAEKNMTMRIKLKMSSSQDKSEDQLLAAVTEFYLNYRSAGL